MLSIPRRNKNISFNSHHSKKAYGRVEVKLKALVQSEQENGQVHNHTGTLEKQTNFLLLPRIKPKLSVVQPAA
jgi:hypothetical protein